MQRNGRRNRECLAGKRQGRGGLGWSCGKVGRQLWAARRQAGGPGRQEISEHELHETLARGCRDKVRQGMAGQLINSASKVVHPHLASCSALNGKKMLTRAMTGMSLEGVSLSEVSQSQRTETVWPRLKDVAEESNAERKQNGGCRGPGEGLGGDRLMHFSFVRSKHVKMDVVTAAQQRVYVTLLCT